MTTGAYLKHRGYSDFFTANYIAPMTAAVWSCSASSMMDFPIRTLVRFWKNHHLIDGLGTKPIWRVCKNRSGDYVQKVVDELEDARAATAVVKVEMLGTDSVRLFLKTDAGDKNIVTADHSAVLFACHSDTALAILNGEYAGKESESASVATLPEKEILGAIKYGKSQVFLHTMPFMPRKKSCWASWNVLSRSPDEINAAARANSKRPVECTYWLNRLQHLPVDEKGRHRFCTLNPVRAPDPNHVIRSLELSHPLFNEKAIAAQLRLDEIQGGHGGRVFFCGAWCGYGFHEDGIRSAVDVVTRHLGVRSFPWGAGAARNETPNTPTPEKSWTETVCLFFDRKACLIFDAEGTVLRLILSWD